MYSLVSLGWSDFFAEGFVPFGAQGCFPARVAIQQRGHYLLYAEDGEWRAEVAGKIHYTARGMEDFPVVGDWVAVRKSGSPGNGVITGILRRKTEFARKAAGFRTNKQVLSANIDRVFLVASCDEEFNTKRLERYLVLARTSGAEPIIVLNKADLAGQPADFLEEARGIAGESTVLLASAKQSHGLEDFRRCLNEGITGALLGSSGVGKSTIINTLLGVEKLRTGDVRDYDGKGRHTTTRRELVLIPSGGLLIDTPGLRELQLWEADAGVQATFDDIEDIALGCRFTDCRHETEPGCAVRKALDEELLDQGRMESYRKMQRELAHATRKASRPASLAEKKRIKKITADQKRGYKRKS